MPGLPGLPDNCPNNRTYFIDGLRRGDRRGRGHYVFLPSDGYAVVASNADCGAVFARDCWIAYGVRLRSDKAALFDVSHV